MYEIGIIDEFEAAHSLRGDFGLATQLHGHTYKVEVIVKGDVVNKDGTLFDIGVLKGNLKDVLNNLHYKNLNDIKVFQDVNSTAENVCKHIYDGMKVGLQNSEVANMKVVLWESSTVFASYSGDLK